MLDHSVRRLGVAGEVVLGGEPYRLRRLSPAGVAALDHLVGGGPAAGGDASRLGRRLVADGVLHPVPPPRAVVGDELDVVVPVRDDSAGLERLLARLRDGFSGRVIVVDDGSGGGESDQIAAMAAAGAAELVRRERAGGPAAARNGARLACRADLVCFLDADALPGAGFLEPLLGHFADRSLGAVAPRVRSTGTGAIARYESSDSPLDLGCEPGRVGAHRRLSYVPSAALVCRRSALDEVGWFDPALRVGEDVDLLRRLETHGWSVRYEPRSLVGHGSRPTLVSLLRQRFGYGTSAAALAGRHPGTVAPFEGSLYVVLPVLALAVAAFGRSRRRLPVSLAVWLASTAVPTRSLGRKLRRVGAGRPGVEALAALAGAQRGAATGLATALRRVWWPAALLAALLLPKARRPLLSLLGVAELAAAPARLRAAGPAGLGLGLLDDAAYGAGVTAGCLRLRSLAALLPRFASADVSDGPSRR